MPNAASPAPVFGRCVDPSTPVSWSATSPFVGAEVGDGAAVGVESGVTVDVGASDGVVGWPAGSVVGRAPLLAGSPASRSSPDRWTAIVTPMASRTTAVAAMS